MKSRKTIIVMAAACFAVGLKETTAQETLKVEYTLEDIEGVRHELQVEEDIEELKFSGAPFASITLPEGSTELRKLWIGHARPGGNMTNLTLPEGLMSLEQLTLWYCGLRT